MDNLTLALYALVDADRALALFGDEEAADALRQQAANLLAQEEEV